MDAFQEENREAGPAATRLLAVECGDEAFEHLRALCTGSRPGWARQGWAGQEYSLSRAGLEEAARLLQAGGGLSHEPLVCVLGVETCTRDEDRCRGTDELSELERLLAFVRLASAAGAAVIVLAEEECPHDDRALMEAGVVDYLVRAHINGPLFERALRYATERKRVENALSSSEQRFRALAESSSIVIATLDQNGTIRYANAAAREVFGYAPAELAGAPFSRLLRSGSGVEGSEQEAPREHLKYLRRRQEESGQPSLQDEGVRRDGSLVPVDVALGEFRANGARFFSVLVRDLSQSRAAEEALRRSEERLGRLAANLPGVVYQWKMEPDGRTAFTFLSEGAAEVLGLPHIKLQSQNTTPIIESAVHPDDREEFWSSIHASARDLSPWKWVGRIRRKRKGLALDFPDPGPSEAEVDEVWLDCRARPSRQADGSIVWDGMMLDVSARMHVEEELRQARSELEARVERRTHQLAKANRALQAEVAERTRAEADVHARARQQEAVAHLSQSALRGAELPILLRGGASLAAATLGLPAATVMHVAPDRAGSGEASAYSTGLPTSEEENFAIHPQSPLRRVLDGEGTVIVEDWDSSDQGGLRKAPALEEAGVRSSLLVPIPGEAAPQGALCLHAREPRHFSAGDVQFAQAIASVLATAIDRHHLEVALSQSRARLQAVLDNTSALIAIKGSDGRYALANKSLERLHGELFPEAPPLLGSRDQDFLPIENAIQMAAHDVQVLQSGQAHTFEETIDHSGGRKYFLSVKFPLLDSGGVPSAVGAISTDITERKSLEIAREAARAEAERARTEADRARAEADRANRAKSEFLSRMSHELRTPLNAILGFAQLLEISRLPDRSQQGVAQILKAGRHLLALINEVLDIARIESGRLTTSIEPVPLRRVLEEVSGLIAPLAAERSIRLHIGPPDHDPESEVPEAEAAVGQGPGDVSGNCECTVMADRQRLIQIMLNLASNAVKYNSEGGNVSIWCEAGPRERVRVLVADDGKGISPHKLERLWVPFDRLDIEKSGVEGTGLGLALSRALAESMSGSLHVRSREGMGSTFWVELDAAPAPEPIPRSTEPSPEQRTATEVGNEAGGEATGTVLYIEDNPSNLLLVEAILRHRPGLRLVTARTGAQGLEAAREAAPGVILLDLDLPDLHGLSVMEKLRTDSLTRSIPVVIVSADATRSQIARLKNAGALDYITKPIDVARLLGLLDQVLAP